MKELQPWQALLQQRPRSELKERIGTLSCYLQSLAVSPAERNTLQRHYYAAALAVALEAPDALYQMCVKPRPNVLMNPVARAYLNLPLTAAQQMTLASLLEESEFTGLPVRKAALIEGGLSPIQFAAVLPGVRLGHWKDLDALHMLHFDAKGGWTFEFQVRWPQGTMNLHLPYRLADVHGLTLACPVINDTPNAVQAFDHMVRNTDHVNLMRMLPPTQ